MSDSIANGKEDCCQKSSGGSVTPGSTVFVEGFTGMTPVQVGGNVTVPLPTGASTSAKQPTLGTTGMPSSDVLTVQGIDSMTPLSVTPDAGANLALESGGNLSNIFGKLPASGTAGTSSANVLTVQGIDSMTPLSVFNDRSSNFALEAGGNLSNMNDNIGFINDKIPNLGIADTTSSVPVAIATDQRGVANNPSSSVFTVQGIDSMTPLLVTASAGTNLNTSNLALERGGNLSNIFGKLPAYGTTTTPSANVLTVQGIASMTPLLVTASAGTNLNTSNLALERGGNLSNIFSKLPAYGTTTTPSVNVLTVQGITNMTPLSVTPGTGANLALETGGNLDKLGAGPQLMAKSLSVTLASDQTNLNTSNLALERGGNLSNIFSKLPAYGTTTTPSVNVLTVQGITSMTPLKVDGSGTSGTPSANVLTVQGITSMTPLSVFNDRSSNFALEVGGNLDNINSKLTGVAKDSSLSTINTTLNVIEADSRAINGTLGTVNTSILAGPNNVTTALRDSFQTFTNGVNWNLSLGSGDIVQVDGNSGGASYLVISKDPLTANTETSITSTATFTIPTELTTGISMSQRTLGQELSVEIVSSDTQNTPSANLAISSIQQIGTTLTVTTSTMHGLVPGTRIGIFGVSGDSRLNYPAIVVGNITNAFTFTVTQGPNGYISNNTTSTFTPPYAGTVYIRPALGYAQDGMSFIFENSTLTNASVYVRQDNGATWSSGTVNQNQSITVGTTASAKYDTSTLYTYNFTPTTEYRMMLQSDRATLTDTGVDNISFNQTNTRISRTQQVPNSTKTYRLRYRFTNDAGLTVPVGKIVSATKTGSTTATITTASAHNLVVGDYVIINGISNQTDFPNCSSGSTAPTITHIIVASITPPNVFTLAIGTTTTGTGYGGMVAKAQGGANYPPFSNVVVTNAQTNTSTNELTLTGINGYINTNYLIGDYVNVYGVRNSSNGGDVGVDGTYKVVNITSTTLILSPFSGTLSGVNTACGGTVIKRTDARIHFSRMLNFQRERVELNARADPSNGYPVIVTSIPTTNTNTNLLLNASTTDIASSNIFVNTVSPVTPSNTSYQILCNVTAITNVNSIMDLTISESDDTGINYYDVYHFPRILATGLYRSPLITLTGSRLRYTQNVSNVAVPNITRAITRISSNTVVPCFRQFYDRTILPNTLSSNTLTYNVQGTKDLTGMVSMGVATSAPTMQAQISPDGISWVQVGSNIVTAASSNTFFQVAGVQANFVRLTVSVAGSGATLNFVFIKAMG